MKLIALALLMCAPPVLNMAGLVELKTLRDLWFGIVIGMIVAALPEDFKRTRHS